MSSVDQPNSRHYRNLMPSPHEFSDEEAADLLRALYCYVEHYDWTKDTITSVVTDLAQSMDRTTDAEDQMRSEIEARFAVGVDPMGPETVEGGLIGQEPY